MPSLNHHAVRNFYFYHGLLPLLILLIASLILDYFRLDLAVADYFYTAEGGSWSLKKSWLLENVLHKGGRFFVATCLIINLTTLIATWYIASWAKYRRGLSYLFATVVVSMLIISGLKAVTHIDCPWDIQRYGGDQAVLSIFGSIFGSGTGRCFPAGHASGGYTWVALYFFCRLYKPRWRFFGLAFGLILGGVFGFAQQFRGAHFLSHDFWTLGICWFTALATYLWQVKTISSVPIRYKDYN